MPCTMVQMLGSSCASEKLPLDSSKDHFKCHQAEWKLFKLSIPKVDLWGYLFCSLNKALPSGYGCLWGRKTSSRGSSFVEVWCWGLRLNLCELISGGASVKSRVDSITICFMLGMVKSVYCWCEWVTISVLILLCTLVRPCDLFPSLCGLQMDWGYFHVKLLWADFQLLHVIYCFCSWCLLGPVLWIPPLPTKKKEALCASNLGVKEIVSIAI